MSVSDDTCNFQANSYGMPLIKTPWGVVPIVYADQTASGIPYRKIDQYIQCRIAPFYANAHSNGYSGRKMAHLLCQSKAAIRRCIGASKEDAIIFTGSGSSSAVTHAIHAMDLERLARDVGERPVVIISDSEHYSNNLPWKTEGTDLVITPTTQSGLIDMQKLAENIEKYRSRRVKVASLSACSNVTGVIQPVEELTVMLKAAGWIVCFDYACSAPYVPICVRPLNNKNANIDCLFISPHKFVGGAGSPGLLVLRKELIRNKCPLNSSGGTVQFSNSTTQIWIDDPEKRESGGTPNIFGEIRCGLAFLLKERMMGMIVRREHELVDLAKRRLATMRGIGMLINTDAPQLPIFPLEFYDLQYNLAVCLLSQLFGVQVRGGISCNGLSAERLLHISKQRESQLVDSIVKHRDISSFGYGWVRLTLHYSMSDEVANYVLNAVEFVALHGHKFKRFYKYNKDLNNWMCRVGSEEPFGELDFKATPPTCLSGRDFDSKMADRLLRRAGKLAEKIR
jgi:selenocysteine lyase/cysteine desulfurase